MGDEILIKKSLNKKFFNVNEKIKVKVVIKNISSHTLENISYEEEISELYELDNNSIVIDGFKITIAKGFNKINIGKIYRGEEKLIEFSLKVKAISGEGKLNLKGFLNYWFYGSEKKVSIEEKTLVKGVRLEIIDFNRDAEVLFSEDIANYKIKIENTGNIVASNIVFRYLSNGNLRTVLDSVKVDGIDYKEVFIERGVNIGTLFKGSTRTLEFSVRMKSSSNNNSSEDYFYAEYEAVVNQEEEPVKEEVKQAINPLIFIKDDIEIFKECSISVISKGKSAVVTTNITNNTGVNIKDLRLWERFNALANIDKIHVNECEYFKLEGSNIIIPLIENGETKVIKYFVSIENSKESFLNIWSEMIYDLGYGECQKRFEKQSNTLTLELNINKLKINAVVDKTIVGIEESFKRNIKIKNISLKEIKRLKVFDKLSKGVSIVNGTISINGEKINNLDDLSFGIDVGALLPTEEISLEYLGETTSICTDNSIVLDCFCQYTIENSTTDETEKSYTESIKTIINIDKVIQTKILSKKIDIKKIKLKEIVSLTGKGNIENIKTIKGLKEIKKEERFVPCSSFLVNGHIEVNLEYLSYVNEDKIMNLTIPVEITETLDGIKENRHRNNGTIEVLNLQGEIINGYLYFTLNYNIVIS